jgi:hypothetical protein
LELTLAPPVKLGDGHWPSVMLHGQAEGLAQGFLRVLPDLAQAARAEARVDPPRRRDLGQAERLNSTAPGPKVSHDPIDLFNLITTSFQLTVKITVLIDRRWMADPISGPNEGWLLLRDS